ncbi:hypothetical protein QP888_03670 [Corynebacterium sp. MSK297]|nr:hypothetical protein [Corynebacterium sp. MSK297]MDK8845623.1 hypothetical protein [Corynebacterium sp. MSK297]
MRNYLDTLADITTTVELFDRRLWHVLIDHGTIELEWAGISDQ